MPCRQRLISARSFAGALYIRRPEPQMPIPSLKESLVILRSPPRKSATAATKRLRIGSRLPSKPFVTGAKLDAKRESIEHERKLYAEGIRSAPLWMHRVFTDR